MTVGQAAESVNLWVRQPQRTQRVPGPRFGRRARQVSPMATGDDTQSQHLPMAGGMHADRNHHRCRDDPTSVADLQIGRIQSAGKVVSYP